MNYGRKDIFEKATKIAVSFDFNLISVDTSVYEAIKDVPIDDWLSGKVKLSGFI